jgi:hypothetical protein
VSGVLAPERAAAAARLHAYLVARHWRPPNLEGPDPGVRWNYRIGRFVKSAAPWWPWRDDLVYLQAQGYWVLANGRLSQAAADVDAGACRGLARVAANGILARQDAEGSWPYPNPEWRGRVATAEGTWACLGLLDAFRRTGDARYLAGAERWDAYVRADVGYQRRGDTLAVNYFGGRQGPRVPNNSAFYLRFLAELAAATGDDRHLGPAAGLVAFLAEVQRPSGEFPYAVEGAEPGRLRDHFQCYQYNAFMLLDLVSYGRLAGDDRALGLARATLGFLAGGLRDDGGAAYACNERFRTVIYHTAVLGAAFRACAALGMAEGDALAHRAFAHVLARQRPDGSFPHSFGDYRLLADRRAYPRNLAMILFHLLDDDEVPRAA